MNFRDIFLTSGKFCEFQKSSINSEIERISVNLIHALKTSEKFYKFQKLLGAPGNFYKPIGRSVKFRDFL